MSKPGTRFEKFGQVADIETRKKLAEWILSQIAGNTEPPPGLNESEAGKYLHAIRQITENKTLRELAKSDPSVAGKLAEEILDFVSKTDRSLKIAENPYEQESQLLESFSRIDQKHFPASWAQVKKFLQQDYSQKEINLPFYENQFAQSLHPDKKNKNQVSFESVKEHLADEWSSLLQRKTEKLELERIETARKPFAEDLYKRLEELKKLRELLQPLTGELGRLLDYTSGQWQNANLNDLKKFAALLERDKSLQELAELLGRLHQAEKELEMETFSATVLKPEWKVDHAAKSDLIGVFESDDLANLLPVEIALLGDPDLEPLFMKKFAEKKLQTFEYTGRTLELEETTELQTRMKSKASEKGPFILCVDTSGSMHGMPEQIAKTICFAILKIAIREQRNCFLISFSTEIQTLDLGNLAHSMNSLLEFLAMSFHGGTDCEPALSESLRQLETEKYKNADVLMISDFVMDQPGKTLQAQMANAKENGNRFHSLVIGSSNNPELKTVFDNTWIYTPGNPRSLLQLLKDLQQIEKNPKK